jgi:NAD(P)-dependent dehydrogenase (short-subunit alcohol dehydrogenase family)
MASTDLAPVWFITGASSGFGKSIALEALSRGHHVIGTARSVSNMSDLAANGAAVFALDVSATEATIAKMVDQAVAVHGRLTHVVNAAGYVVEGAVEEVNQAEATAQFATNVIGAITVSRLTIPHLRAHPKSSDPKLIPSLSNFGSLGSWCGAPAVAHYCATKWAISGLTESLRDELESFGINVTVIEPGYFRTEFLNTNGGRRAFSKDRLDDVYKDTAVGAYRELLTQANNKQPGDVEKGARVVVDILTGTGVGKGRNVPMRIVLGKDCVGAIREKMRHTEELLKEWEDVFTSTDHDDVKSA